MGDEICAPMPGRIVKILVELGEHVAPNTPVVVVEAMKMENELCAEGGGVVTEIAVAPGQSVEGGAVLLRIGAPDDAQ